MNDPINPAHYAGRACADIGERLTANGYQILKYVWRLGKKDELIVEVGKARWYAQSEVALLRALDGVLPDIKTQPMVADLSDPRLFLETRLVDQPSLVCDVARFLWNGYDATQMEQLVHLLRDDANTD